MAKPNATSMWLNEQCKQGLTQFLERKARMSKGLHHEKPQDIEDHIHSTFMLWIQRDAFAKRLAEGKPPSWAVLPHFVSLNAYNTMRSRGVDAHMRTFTNARTETERKKGADANANFVSEFRTIEFRDSDNQWDAVCINQKTAEDLLNLQDLREVGNRIVVDSCKRRQAAGDRLGKVWDMMVEGADVLDVSEALGVSPLRASHLTSRVRERIRKEADRVKSLLIAMRGIQRGEDVDPEIVRELEGMGLVSTESGFPDLTKSGISRLREGWGGGWHTMMMM
jgi:hypothetical protein